MKEEQEKKYDKKRTKPVRSSHRAAIELCSNPSKTERIVAGARNRYLKVLKAQKAYEEYIYSKVMEDIIDSYNEGVDEDRQIDTIQLFSHNGDMKLSVERLIQRSLDSRADMAKTLVEEYLADVENKTIELDADAKLVYNLLRGIFFKKQGFKFTPSLWHFLKLDEKDIHDKRLKKAHKLLKESIRVDRSNWYAHIYEYKTDETTGKGYYEKLSLEDCNDK